MRKLQLLGGLALISSLAAFAMVPSPNPGPGAIEDMLRGMFKALDAGDRTAVKDCIAGEDSPFPVLVYDLDLENKPVSCEGTKATQKYLDGLFDALAKDKATIASKVASIHADCHSPEMGYATFELAQAVTVGGKTDTSRQRVTAIVTSSTKDKKWRIFHWHASAAAEPAKDAAGKAGK